MSHHAGEFTPSEDCPSDCYDMERHSPMCPHAPEPVEREPDYDAETPREIHIREYYQKYQ